jgi:hypothetical protein
MRRSCVAIACYWILVTIALAQDISAKDIGLLAKIENTLITWFDQISKSADQIADKEDKRKLSTSLRQLQGSVYSVEEHGRDLVTTLEKKPLNQANAMKEVSDTRSALLELKNALHRFGLALRNLSNQYGSGGDDAEKMIAEAVDKRSIWLSDVESEIKSGHISDETVKQGRWILEHQRTASLAIDQLLGKLDK